MRAKRFRIQKQPFCPMQNDEPEDKFSAFNCWFVGCLAQRAATLKNHGRHSMVYAGLFATVLCTMVRWIPSERRKTYMHAVACCKASTRVSYLTKRYH